MSMKTANRHHKHHVLIVGGGFGGIKAALELSKQRDFAVTLLTDRPEFCYYPALYHTATGGLRSESSIPLANVLPTDRVALAIGTAMTLDRVHKTVTTKEGHIIPYDTLILSMGVVTNYFGIKGLENYSYGIKSRQEVDRLKNHLHKQLLDEHAPDLNYVIVGAGPTGIELAGVLPEYIRTLMKNHHVKGRPIHVDLIEAQPRLLPHASKDTSRAVRKHLRRLGVHLYLGKSVEGETADALMINGRCITSHTVVWTAGTANNPFYDRNHFASCNRHKVIVNEYLMAEPDIYAIGDGASTPYSGYAQTALYDARFVASNLIREAAGKRPRKYKPKRPVAIITAGRRWAAVDWGRWHFYGILGWWLRLAADWSAFHEFERWWPATEQWSTEFGLEETCPVCAAAIRLPAPRALPAAR
jgi:NADH dehydrogenase